MELVDRFGSPLYSGEKIQLSSPNAKKIVVDLMQQTRSLTKKDIKSWRSAWQLAINAENPNRNNLYNVYYDTDIDMHITGCIGQRLGVVLNQSFKIADVNTKKKDDKLTELFEADWFKDFILYSLQSRYWGHSLIELGQVLEVRGKKRFDRVVLVPREHVKPEFGVIVKNPSDEAKDGFPYLDSPMTAWVIPAGKPNDLGLFLKVAPGAISKRNMGIFWDTFGEIFGIPIRIAHTSTKDEAEHEQIESMLAKMGAASYGLFPEGTEIEFMEAQRSDSYMVFDKRIERLNREISKALLCQTMTIEDGASLSQSEVHLKMFERTVQSDADFVRDLVNNELIPRMQMHGFPLTDKHQFDWDYSIEYTPDQSRAVENMVLQYFQVDGKYFVEKYNIDITGERENPRQGERLKAEIPDFFD